MLNIDYSVVKPDDVSLIKEIESYYNTICSLNGTIPDLDRYKCFMVFAYNLIECGLLDKAVYILDNDIDPSYYGEGLLAHIDKAVKHLQEIENMKNRVDQESKEVVKKCKEEVEYLYVLNGMMRHVPNLNFKYRQEFNKFINETVGKSWEVQVRPNIGLVKN